MHLPALSCRYVPPNQPAGPHARPRGLPPRADRPPRGRPTYGAGDGTTTFNLPDMGGRTFFGKEAVASSLTAAVGGIDGATLGAAGGAQSVTLATANLPPYTPAGSVSVASTAGNVLRGSNAGSISFQSGGSFALDGVVNGSLVAGAITSTGTLTGSAQGGTSTPVANVPPGIVGNWIMRIL